MSGIAGIIHFDGRPVEAGQIEAMTGAMHYRGPDGIEHWRSGPVALGHCMLRSTPESLVEAQPLSNDNGSLVLVMDGRVDNWAELRAELVGKGACLRTRADAELVLRAYEIWGRECLERIDGDFAFVIWDARRREAFCARDRVGNRPFNYHWNGVTLVFASDLHTILPLPWIPNVLNEGFVAEQLSTEWHSLHETFWRDVFRLAPAHSIVFNAGGQNRRCYWWPDLEARLPFQRDEEYIEHYRALFVDVVRRMSRSQHALACEVSGGLDSSAIFAVAEALRKQSALLAPGLEGYTLGFHGDAFADEHRFSDAVAAHTGRSLHVMEPGRFSLSWYRQFASTFKEFPGFPNWTMLASLSQEAKSSGSRVMLCGTGGDEWLAGVESWVRQAFRRGDPKEIFHILGKQIPQIGVAASLWFLIRHGAIPMAPSSVKAAIKAALRLARLSSPTPCGNWLSPGLLRQLGSRVERAPKLVGASGGSRVQNRQLNILHHPFVLLGREMSERQAAHCGVERRQPFWNRRIIEAAFATPETFRLRMGVDKWLHKKAMAGYLPECVLQRNDKADFFSVFVDSRHELLQACESLLDSRPEWVATRKLKLFLERGLPTDQTVRQDLGLWALVAVDAMAAPP